MASQFPTTYNPLVYQAAQQYGLDPAIFLALGQVESSMRPTVVSSAGAVGLYQITPIAAQQVGMQGQSMYDPYANIQTGAKYLDWLLDNSAQGDYNKAITYYNCGPGNVCPAGVAEAQKVMALAYPDLKAGGFGGGIATGGGIGTYPSGPTNVAIGGAPATQGQADAIQKEQNENSVLGWLQARLGDFTMVGFGLVILAAAVILANRKTIIQVATSAAKVV